MCYNKRERVIDMELGKIIETRRKELKLSLEEVGKAVGVGKSTVKKWETGAIANMRRDKIALLAEKLKLDPALFIEENAVFSVTADGKIKRLPAEDSLEDNRETSDNILTENENAMLQLFRMVPEDRQSELIALIESALKMNGLLQ